MIKDDLIRSLMDDLSLEKNQSKKIIEMLLELIKRSLTDGNEIMITGFGQFKVSQKKSRAGRNPKTLEKYEISPRKVVTYYPSKIFRKELNS